jgi:hypothetical protein
MNHLTDVELVDLLDDRLAPARRDHAETCAACQSQAVALRAALERLSLDQVPEPSPLFWDHFSARVARAVGAEGAPSRAAGWLAWGAPGVRWSAAAAAFVLLIGLSWSVLAPTTPAPPIAPAAAGWADAAGSTGGWLLDPETDEAWAVVRSAADGLAWEDVAAAGITPRPGSADHVVMEMTVGERTELARLIEDELRRSGS